MKILSWLVGLGAVQLPMGALGARATLGFNNLLLASSNASSVSFATRSYDVPTELLMSVDASVRAIADDDEGPSIDIYRADGRVACTEESSIANSGDVTVVLAFSKCLSEAQLATLDAWVEEVKTAVAAEAAEGGLTLTFASTMVPGACEAISEKNKQGLEDDTMEDQAGVPAEVVIDEAQEVLPSDLARLEAFPSFGRVLSALDEVVETKPVAVISFVTDETSFGEVTQYENSLHLSETFNFQICKSGKNCDGSFTNCIPLDQDVDIFMYNPFTVTRSLSCSNLDGGVPVTHVDSDGTRQCFCGCPAGYEQQLDGDDNEECVKTREEVCPCVWAEMGGFKKEITSKEAVCSFDDVVSGWGLPVPFPTDGYVSDKRINIKEGSMEPRVEVHVKRRQDPEYSAWNIFSSIGSATPPNKYADVVAIDSDASAYSPLVPSTSSVSVHDSTDSWKTYQMSHDDVLDEITFTSYGKYSLKMDAYDYYDDATCEGCMVILDKFRPQATTSCPESFCDYVSGGPSCTDTAELTMANLATVDAQMDEYFDFADDAENDACGGTRCDDKTFMVRNFYENSYSDKTSSYSEAGTFWEASPTFGRDWLSHSKSSRNPLVKADGCVDNTDSPVPPNQCTRCTKMHTALRELWTDYRCNSDFDVRYCDGDASQTCDWKQCLVMHGDTMATATAAIKASVVAESEKVLEHVEQEGWQTTTQVHHALECTEFGAEDDGECEFKAKLSDLVETTQEWEVDMQGADPADYVHWRYKVENTGEKWRLWKDASGTDDELTFTDPETKITVEAWTQCGIVRRFFFYVHLHVNSVIDVCDKFSDMWYQTSISRLPVGVDMCAYPGSDFAELTFDFHPNAGLIYSNVQLRMNVSEVVCHGKLEDRSAVEILKITGESPEIVSRFAVQMLHDPNTEAATDFRVSCDFTYAQYGGASRTETCARDFSIEDCKGPEFGVPDGECEFTACAGSDEPGLYEACGGTIVSATDSCTEVTAGDGETCCQGCTDTTIVCKALLDLPDGDEDLMRCEPLSTGGVYSTYYTSYTLLAEATQTHPAATALLSASALVAVVALVVVRRRVGASRTTEMADDAYYPLLH